MQNTVTDKLKAQPYQNLINGSLMVNPIIELIIKTRSNGADGDGGVPILIQGPNWCFNNNTPPTNCRCCDDRNFFGRSHIPPYCWTGLVD